MEVLVIWFLRKSQPNFKSIETVFSSLESTISKHVVLVKKELPQSRLNIKNIFNNLIFTHKNKSAINHITGHSNYIALTSGSNSILTIHDIESAFESHFFKNIFILLFWFWIPCLLVKRITVISNHTQLKLKKYIPFAKHKIRVIHNPVGTEFKPVTKDFNTLNPTVLCMGTKPNKNLEAAFNSVAGLPCTLHIIGVLTTAQKNLLNNLQLNYNNSVFLTREAIVQAYIDCDVLCFPSTYEGFGMPIIEAQATGRPVLTSNLGAMKEVAGDAACLVDPYDVDAIKAGLEQIIADTVYRAKLIEKGFENVKRFSLERISAQYMDLYKEMTA